MNSKSRISLSPSKAAASELDRRIEPREAAEGRATLVVLDGGWKLEGDLIDTSASGFRLMHRHGGLCTGSEVSFQYDDVTSGEHRQGRAKVCWNRISSGSVESGFLITSARF